MPFQKGHKLATGRPKGSKDVKTESFEIMGEYLTREGAIRYLNILKTSEDKEYLDRYERIIEYFKPKRARNEQHIEFEGETFLSGILNDK